MWLLIDAGNTRIKWALLPAQPIAPSWHPRHGVTTGWLATGAFAHAELDAAAIDWQERGVTRVVIANVAGAALQETLARVLQQRLGLPLAGLHWFTATAAAGGVRNGYQNPVQLGCDRFAALIGARALFAQQALIVANCGTATTIDALRSDGLFCGGMILPGLALMTTALARQAALLPQIALPATAPPRFADHTDGAIASGCLNAQAGAIERAVAAHAGALCILSGGAAAWIAPSLTVPHHLVDNLVLLGLQAACTGHSSC